MDPKKEEAVGQLLMTIWQSHLKLQAEVAALRELVVSRYAKEGDETLDELISDLRHLEEKNREQILGKIEDVAPFVAAVLDQDGTSKGKPPMDSK